MKIKISEIPEAGLTVSERFNPVEMSLQTAELKFTAPLEVTATFQKERDTVLVQVEAAGNTEMVCGRCLEVYRQPFDGRFDLGYELKGKVALDITNDVRQEILLSYPVQFLCRPDCQGLCPKCGKNLNEGSCSCSR